jgi:hypothetical protein
MERDQFVHSVLYERQILAGMIQTTVSGFLER